MNAFKVVAEFSQNKDFWVLVSLFPFGIILFWVHRQNQVNTIRQILPVLKNTVVFQLHKRMSWGMGKNRYQDQCFTFLVLSQLGNIKASVLEKAERVFFIDPFDFVSTQWFLRTSAVANHELKDASTNVATARRDMKKLAVLVVSGAEDYGPRHLIWLEVERTSHFVTVRVCLKKSSNFAAKLVARALVQLLRELGWLVHLVLRETYSVTPVSD
jgi:hypothetical protein